MIHVLIMENQDLEAQELVNKIYEYATDLMFEQEISPSETKDILIEQGLAPEDADIVISNLQAQMREAKISVANKNMLYGALWCIGGLLVTALTYAAASEGGGIYIVTGGAILGGAIQFLKGLFQFIYYSI